MRNKFLGTGTPGYNPLRKLRTIFSGLRYAVLDDLAWTYKLGLWWLVPGSPRGGATRRHEGSTRGRCRRGPRRK